MRFSLDVRRAHQGDCFLLHTGTRTAPSLAVIDGGPADVYKPQLRPRLVKIKEARGLTSSEPLPIDLVMVSHVDDDHIHGILDLTRELRTATGVPFAQIASIWHNSFDDVIGNTPKELTAAVTAQFGAASLSDGLSADTTIDSDEHEEVVLSSLKVLASIEQGHQLRLDADKLNVPLNPEFGEKLIIANSTPLDMGDGLTFLVVGPMVPDLKKLQARHDQWLKELKARGLKPGDALAAYVDNSVPNLSSVVVLASCGGKSILLTGDARGDKILQGLESGGALKPGKSVKAVWKLSAVRPGKYTVAYQVGAGLSAETKAKTSSGVTPGGSFVADITTELPETEVNGAGEIVEIEDGKPKSGN